MSSGIIAAVSSYRPLRVFINVYKNLHLFYICMFTPNNCTICFSFLTFPSHFIIKLALGGTILISLTTQPQTPRKAW